MRNKGTRGRCIENGIDYLTLKDILGHTDIKITLDTYCDVLGEYKERQYQLVEKISQTMSEPAQKSEKNHCKFAVDLQ